MEVASTENYPESPQLEESVQSLYADEQPKRTLKSNEKHSKLADTVSIENTIMLNAEDLVKVTTTSRPYDEATRDQSDPKFDAQSRPTRAYAHATNRRKVTANRRQIHESRRSPAGDVNLGNASAETRTSVIRGLSGNRKRQPASSGSESEETSIGEKDDVNKDFGHLHCYEQFEKDTGNVAENLSGRRNFIQNTKESRMETSRNCLTQPDSSITRDNISENLSRGSVSVARSVSYPLPLVDGRPFQHPPNAVYRPQHVHDLKTQYRMQQPSEYPVSQAEQRGKQYYDRSSLMSAQSSGPGMVPQGYSLNPHGKFGMPEKLYVQTHSELPNTFSGYSVHETRSSASSSSSGKDREQLPDQEALKGVVQHYPSPVSNIKEEHGQGSPRHNSLERGVVSQGKSSGETTDTKQLDGNKNVKGKRKQSGKPENANQCGQCWKTFASSSALAKHKLTHSDERRYICKVCSKGFKRQDHLNGHMLTHRDKKPYACEVSSCEKSYCDMRSLRRHYENYHPKRVSLHPTTSSSTTGSFKQDSEQISHKVSSSRQRQDESTAPDVEESRSSPMSVQELGHHGKSKPESSHTAVRRQRNSDSMCSNNSEDMSRRPDSHSPHQMHAYDKPTSGVNMFKQVVEQSLDSKGEKHVLEGYPRPGYYQYPDGVSSQWYHRYPSQMIQMYQINTSQVPVLVTQSIGPYHGQIHNNPYPSGDPPQMVPNYPFVNQSQTSRSNERNGDGSSQPSSRKEEENERPGMIIRDSGAPTDPTSVAILNAKDLPKKPVYKEGNPAVPPMVQWKTVQVNEDHSGMPPFSMGNNPASMQYNPVNFGVTLPERKVSHEQPAPLNISIPSNQVEKRCQDMMDVDHERQAKRHCPPQTLPFNVGEERLLRIGDGNMKPPSSTENKHEDLFRNLPSTPPRKSRPKPEPIHIPRSALSCSPLSPPIYTPPPMLSPRSIYHINTPRCGGATPLTPSRFFLGNRSRKNSLEGENDQQEVIIPEPKINIGPQFQAEIPRGVATRKEAEYDKHRAAICWVPFENETKKRRQEIEAFLDMACSVAVYGGGSNKEYALHVLYRLKGNIKLAVRHILASKSAIQKEDGLGNYHYEGSEKWSAKERLKFREAFSAKGKDFFQISKEVETKSVAQCVEFYYLWKATHPEAMRSRTRYAETESESETVEYLSDNEGNSTLVFECDFPECNSKFISRQALNGHIRVHGGSFMKPSEPKRTKVKTTANPESGDSNSSEPTSVNRPATKSAKPPSTNGPGVPNGDGPLPEFACKVCGRIFHKIKSRSAHMKTHVKRSDEDHAAGSKM